MSIVQGHGERHHFLVGKSTVNTNKTVFIVVLAAQRLLRAIVTLSSYKNIQNISVHLPLVIGSDRLAAEAERYDRIGGDTDFLSNLSALVRVGVLEATAAVFLSDTFSGTVQGERVIDGRQRKPQCGKHTLKRNLGQLGQRGQQGKLYPRGQSGQSEGKVSQSEWSGEQGKASQGGQSGEGEQGGEGE